jgi:ATP-dependent RNA helicase DBP3
MSSSESEDEQKDVNQRRVGNAFAGLDLDSDSDSDSDSDDDNKEETIDIPAVKAHEPRDDGEDESSSSVDEDDDGEGGDEQIGSLNLMEAQQDAHKDEMSEFDDLVGRSTRHGTILQADYVEAIKQLIDSKSSTVSSRPTEIQCECWTTMLSPLTRDRDVIAISKTGSGKTLAFLVPLLASLASSKSSRQKKSKDATFVYPRAIILAPTRVLAQQIFEVASTLVKNTPSLLPDVTVSVALGGSAYHQQMTNLLADDPDVIIATPGRLNSLCGYIVPTTPTDTTTHDDNDDDNELAMCIKLDNVCELVIDEADMMLALGFKNALLWFAQEVNATSVEGFRLVLTSATWEEETSANLSRFESISQEEPVLLTSEGAGQVVTKNVTQRVEVLAHKGAPRFNYLVRLLTTALLNKDDLLGSSSNRVIVFLPHKSQTRQMGKDLHSKGIANVVLEGDMSQSARVAAIEAFRNGTQGRRVLVATDVAARGLDVLSVSHVFNYSLGISIESYIHRCGRTGRAGRFGVAHTFVVKGVDEKLSPELCSVLKQANQFMSDDLKVMAVKELKKRNRGSSAATPKDEEEREEAEELLDLRKANREKQLRKHQQNQQGSKNNNSKRRGRK